MRPSAEAPKTFYINKGFDPPDGEREKTDTREEEGR